MMTGNKGEWSEVYTLLKIISDQQLYGGDGDLNKIESLFYPIIKVLRDESNGTFEFSYDKNLVVIKNNKEEFKISVEEFQKKAKLLFDKLREKTNATFSIPEIESFISSYNSTSIKAKSSVKSDIRIVVHDLRTGTTPELGFSIKSKLGEASTLLNAGKTTNFIYKIEGVSFSEEQINLINAIDTRSKIKDRIEKIYELGGNLCFIMTENSTFENNLILIDSSLPKIISESLKIFFTSNLSKSIDLLNRVSQLNPLNFDLKSNHPFYSYKFKRFITDIALGMMPSKVWTGQIDATGGYLVVKENGDVLCYHIYNRNEFENYLYSNTKFETASSSRHDFGSIYKENDEFYFKLNLQIRFL